MTYKIWADADCTECGGSGEIYEPETTVPYGDTWVHYGGGTYICECVWRAQELNRAYQAWLESLDDETLDAIYELGVEL